MDAVAGAGQQTGAVQHLLATPRIRVQALVDAQAGLAQPGQAVSEGLILSRQVVGLLSILSPRLDCGSPDIPACTHRPVAESGFETTGAIMPEPAKCYKTS